MDTEELDELAILFESEYQGKLLDGLEWFSWFSKKTRERKGVTSADFEAWASLVRTRVKNSLELILDVTTPRPKGTGLLRID